MSTVLDQGNRTFIGSVLFLDIVGYTKKSVAAQIAMKDRFTSLLSASLKDIAADQRIILDTGDGAAITFLGDPEDALFVAMQLRDALRLPEGEAGAGDPGVPVDVPIRTGINLGPVKLVRDINGQPNIVGDGINVAQRIMSFAPTRQIVVSRSFYDMVSVISEEYSKLFTYEGSRTDKHVRDHEIYVVGESAAAFKQALDGMTDRAAITNSRAKALKIEAAAPAAGATATMPAQAGATPTAGNRNHLLAGGALAALVVALGVALVVKTSGEKPAPATAAPAPAPTQAATQAAPAPAPATAPATADAAAKAPAAVPAPKAAEAKPATPPADIPGVLTFGIQPWGEVFINGKSIGVSPPMKQTKLAAGQYTVEVRNTSFPTFTTRVDIKPKETRNIAHKF